MCSCEGLNGATVQQQQQQQQLAGDDDDVNDDVTTSYQLILKCLTDGQPTPSIEWLRNYVRSVCSHVGGVGRYFRV